MKYSIKSYKAISLILIFSLIVSVFSFVPNYSYAETDASLSEEALLEKKLEEPEDNVDFDGYIVSIKDSRIDIVNDTDLAEDIPSSESDKYYLIDTTGEALELASASSIEVVEPNYKRYSTVAYPPNDAYYRTSINFGSSSSPFYRAGAATAYPNMGIDSLWENDLHGEGVHIAVLDSGINSHRDMTSPNRTLISPDNGNIYSASPGNDQNGHGTMVTSVIHAGYNNTVNIAGIASEAKLTSINVFTKDGNDLYATSWQTSKAYEYLLNNDTPDVINCSYGGPGKSTQEETLLAALENKGCIVIAANGNDGASTKNLNEINYPANYSSVIGVGATDAGGTITDFSSKNVSVEVSAWGDYVTVVSPSNTSGTSAASGTSFSSPVVAGIVACLKEHYDDLDTDLFRELIKTTSTQKLGSGKNNTYGYGFINAEKMLQELSNYKLTFVTNGGTWQDTFPTQYAFSSKETLLPTDIIIEGSKFKGWYMDEALTKGPYTSIPAKTKNDLTLYAKWGTTSAISFNTGNGTSITTTNKTIDSTYGKLPDLTRTGYTFGGWYLDKAYKNRITENTIVGNLDQTIYAKWTANPQKITLVNQGKKTTKTYYYDSKLTGISNPTRKGYSFAGWYTGSSGGTKINASTIVRSNMNLYARWKANKYTVKFNVNKGKSIKKKSKKVTFDKKYGTLPKPKRAGYKFKGWYTKKSGGKKVTKNTKLKTSKTHTLYARWKKK